MEMENAGPKRKYVGSACQACRSSKIKCDGAQPTCGNCAKRGRYCQYLFNDDKRRVSLRTAVDILSRRVSLLSEELIHNGIDIPPMDSGEESTLRDIYTTLSIAMSPLQDRERDRSPAVSHCKSVETSRNAGLWQGPVIKATRVAGTQEDSSVSNEYPTDGSMVGWPWLVTEADPFFMLDPLAFGPSCGEPSFMPQDSAFITYLNDNSSHISGLVSGNTSDEEVEADLVHEVSARFGALRIASDGQLRYYGAATNYHLLAGSRHDGNTDLPTNEHGWLSRLEQVGLGQNVPAVLENQLIELYFQWHNPSHLIVDRDAFLAAREEGAETTTTTPYTSMVLLNAICAVGAAYESRYHPIFVTYPLPLTDYFASRAKVLLETELNCPTISTVQALCILSSYEATRNRDARTWLYGGMAMRLAFDLGLHVDCSPYARAGLLSPDDIRIRRSTFWSCVVLNHLSSFHFGRPFRIDSEEITVQPPLETINSVSTTDQEIDHVEVTRIANQNKLPGSWVFLCETMVPLMRKLYGSSSTPVTTLQEISSSVTHRLQEWWQNLPRSLQIVNGEKISPEIILLHMVYHHFQILIHRPWTSRQSQPWTGQGPGFRHARCTCSTSASSIALLLILYEKHHGFRRMHSYAVNIIFSASLIRLFDVIAFKVEPALDIMSSEATANLGIFFRALDDLSGSFDSATRAREHLATIQRKWHSSELQPDATSKRVQQPTGMSSKPKRPRILDPT